jgi:hypothetical protein
MCNGTLYYGFALTNNDIYEILNRMYNLKMIDDDKMEILQDEVFEIIKYIQFNDNIDFNCIYFDYTNKESVIYKIIFGIKLSDLEFDYAGALDVDIEPSINDKQNIKKFIDNNEFFQNYNIKKYMVLDSEK